MKYNISLFGALLAALLAPLLTFAQASSQPALPSTFLETAYARPAGQRRVLAAGGDLQATLDAAQPGDTIELAAGATFTGHFTLPLKTGAGWIYIQSATLAGLPSEGTRVTPAAAPAMAKLLTPDAAPVLKVAPGAHHFRLVGLEIAVAPGVVSNGDLILLGAGFRPQDTLAEVPHDLVIDRCYIHGNTTGSAKRGVGLHGARTSILDSHLSAFAVVGQEAQAIAGWNGPGPFKIVNNHIEGAGENLMFGGADASIADLVPSDIEIRGNHFYKPLSWNPHHPSYAGRHWTVKNSFELKCARRVLVEGNTFENCWVDGQVGFAIVLTPRNAGGGNPWAEVSDVTFRHNIVRHTAGGVNILGHSDNFPAQQLARVRIENNVFEDVGGSVWGGNGRLYQVLTGTADVTITHNTGIQTATILNFDGLAHEGLVYTNNLSPRGTYGVFGSGSAEGTTSLEQYAPGSEFAGNALTGGTASRYPAGNLFPADLNAMQFEDLAGGNYRLAATSPGHDAATDGTDVGADIDALEAAMGGPAPLPATNGPTISEVSASGVTAQSAEIGWVTDEAADTQVEYGTTVAYGRRTSVDPALVTAHVETPEGLAAGTLYHYRVRSSHAGGTSVSGDYTFRTPDTQMPTIGGVSATGVSSTAATVVWQTDEAADTQVEYGTSSAYGSATALVASMVTAHTQTLSGLAAGTLYHYRVASRDAAGNLAVSSDFTFRTSDTVKPLISAVGTSSVTASSALVSWSTNEASDTQVEYGTSPALGNTTALVASMVTAHTQTLSGLTADTLYHYSVRSRDAAGNLAVSGVLTFRTAAAGPPVTTGTGLKGQYFDSSSLTTLRMTRTDATVNFNWGLGTPAPAINGSFSVRWTGQVQALYSQVYTFYTTTDDGVRLWVNGRLVISDWRGHTAETNAGIPITLVAGTKYDIRMEYFDNAGAASAKLEWSSASQARGLVPQIQLYPAP